MATINLGNIKFTWKGAYNASTAYAIDDVVSYNGSSYIAKTATTGNLPTVTANWDIMSSAGTNGTNGTDGTDLGTVLTTQGDTVVRGASGLERLAIGTAGQALKVNSSANGFEFGSAGGLIQTVSTNNGFHSSNSQSWTSTGYEVTITPTSASNKIHVHCNLSHAGTQGNASLWKIMRSINGGTYGDVDLPTARGSREPAHAGTEHHPSNGASFVTLRIIDSTHNTTNAITYRLYKKQESTSETTLIGNPHNTDANSSTAQTATINTNMIAEERT